MQLITIFTSLLITCAPQVFAAGVLLVPKSSSSFMALGTFNLEHSVEHLATFNSHTVYKTSLRNYKLYQNTFESLYEVEVDEVVTLDPSLLDVSSPHDEVTLAQTPWHLDRISKRALHLDGTYPYSEPGSCHRNSKLEINTYIVDTGIDVSHPEFQGRATWLANFAGDNQDTDCNSHGTHCSGLVSAKTFGACKDARVFAVKVLNCQGSGSYSGIIAGLDFVYKRHLEQSAKNPNVRSIMSMSLGGGKSMAINRAVENMLKSNTMYVVVASGNENSDACNTSPASAKGVFTVNAMGRDDSRAYFSNYGPCSDIYSPGVDIESTVPGNKTAVYSGTSMACPITAGVLNHYVDMYPNMNMAQIKQKMLSEATKNAITGNPNKRTPNLLVYLNRV
jgi:hypothetical protein